MKIFKYIFISFICISLFSQCQSQREKDYQQIAAFENVLFENKTTSIQPEKADSIIMLYENYASHYEKDSLSPDYLLRAADVAIQMKNGTKAISLLDKITGTYPDCKQAPEATYYKALCYNEILKDSTKARENCERFLQKYPNHYRASDIKDLQMIIGLSDTQLMDMILKKSQEHEASNQ